MTRVMVRDEPSTTQPDVDGRACSPFTGLAGEPLGDADLRRWPFGIGAVETRDGVTFFHSRHPDGFTPDDLRRTPADGRRYELVDGTIVVSPSRGYAHQLAVAHLLARLVGAQTGAARALPAPFDVTLATGRVLAPDIVVLAHPKAKIPLLVVEVLSRFGRSYDRRDKFDEYETAGIPSYWIVDPDVPAVFVFELTKGRYEQGRYEQVAYAEGPATCTVERPFPLSFSPADLLA
ncbi:Uma2 family endonuclease [Frankia sp. Cr2]|uniref:Uma2 family endonuclease n=1 Tax=Frankia sp. Cr2 TaxID=3073932 RepID=UPI002AD5325C|nr:Uma2 family endonuclease [Frankia sp. Cr2]